MRTQAIKKLASALLRDGADELREQVQRDNRLYHIRRAAETKKSLGYIETLEDLEKVAGERCSCGKDPDHSKVAFLQDGKVVDEMCPILWYRKLVRLTYERTKQATKFQEQFPLKNFLRGYRL